MGSLYSGTSVSGYNSNPPPDDGTLGANNQITWTGIKSKIGDPLNTFATAVNTNITNAFNKTLSGASVVKTAVNYPATAADQGRIIVATASAITVTTPDATSVLSPFVFTVNNQSTGNITVAGFSAQTIDGSNTAKLGANRGITLWTDGSNWFSSGLVQGNLPLTNPGFGFDTAINLQLNASVGSNLLTIAVKANDGTDPTTSNPVLIPFRDSSGSAGDPLWVAVTSALSINTNATGASLGTANSVPFRIWIVCFNNGGTPVLALWQSVTGGATPTAIAALNETNPAVSTTAISAAATSAGVFYSPNGTTITNKSFRILGFVEYQSGLATAGTYSSGPNIVQLFGPGIKKPGDTVQTVQSIATSGSTNNTASYTASNRQLSITPTDSPNLIFATAQGSLTNNTDGSQSFARLSRGTVNNTGMFGNDSGGSVGATNGSTGFSNFGWDAPGSAASTTYAIQILAVANTVGFANNVGMSLTEIMV